MRPAWLASLLLPVTVFAQGSAMVRIPHDRPFWIGKTEVTVSEFDRFANVTGYRTAAERANAARTRKTPGFKVSGKQPVVYVTFTDAAAYCEWTGGRLPSDAEWEFAARAGATSRHYWGDTMDERYLWHRANSDGRPPGPLIGLSQYAKVPIKLEHRYDDIGFRCACSDPAPSGGPH